LKKFGVPTLSDLLLKAAKGFIQSSCLYCPTLELARIYRSSPEMLSKADRQLTEAERARQADSVIHALITAHPNDAQVYLTGYSYRREHGLEQAAEHLTKALELEPDSMAVRLACGRAAHERAREDVCNGLLLAARDDDEQAREHYQHVLERVPTNPQPHFLLAQLQLEQGQFDEAAGSGAERRRPKSSAADRPAGRMPSRATRHRAATSQAGGRTAGELRKHTSAPKEL